MKYRSQLAAAILIPLLVACGSDDDNSTGNTGNTGNTGDTNDNTGNNNNGSGTGDNDGSGNTTDPRPRPDSGTVKSSSIKGVSVVNIGRHGMAGQGPVINNAGNNGNFPRLALGDFLWVNNAFNFGNTRFADWSQQIEITGSDQDHSVSVSYDWGGELDLNSRFNTVSFPELIFGTKSEDEFSGSFEATGLPIENSKLPNEIFITYDYSYNQRSTNSPTGDFGANASGQSTGLVNEDFSGFNVAIESFWHDSCDVVRTSDPSESNQVFEMMVWLHIGKRGPVSEGRNGASAETFTDSNGRVYDVFTKTNAFFFPQGSPESNVRNYIAFVAREPETQSGTIPYHEFIREARTRATVYSNTDDWRLLEDSDCLANILLGTETWYGAADFQWNNLTIEQRY